MRRQGNEQYISLKSIAGKSKMCCFSSPEFRDRVLIAAHQLGLKLQEFVLHAVRDKLQGHHIHTLEQRRSVALQALFASKGTPENIKRAVAELLAPYMPSS